jgi:hypothetical protein
VNNCHVFVSEFGKECCKNFLDGRKSQLLAGSNIYITEDFSKRVKDRRMELQKFMKKLKKRSVNENNTASTKRWDSGY